MGRYDSVKIKKITNGGKHDGIVKRDTKYYDIIPESNNDIYVMATVGDRLDQLANQYYGDPHLWWYIARANNLSFNNLETGIVIRIPASTVGIQ